MDEEHFEGGTLYFGSPGVNGDLDWTPIGTFSELDISTGIDGDDNHEPDQPYAALSREEEFEWTVNVKPFSSLKLVYILSGRGWRGCVAVIRTCLALLMNWFSRLKNSKKE